MAVFNLAEAWGLRGEGTNRCRRIDRYPERARERFLSSEELRRLGAVLHTAEREGLPWRRLLGRPTSKDDRKPVSQRSLLAWQVNAAIRLLLFTGCRLGEVLRMRCNEVDFQTGLVTLPETKAGKLQVVALSIHARELLLTLPRVGGSPWILPAINDPSRHFSKDTLERAWQRIRAAAGLDETEQPAGPTARAVRLHDFRHTVGTHAGQVGANAFLIRDLLRHNSIAVAERYVNRAEDPLRNLTERVSARIAASLVGHDVATL